MTPAAHAVDEYCADRALSHKLCCTERLYYSRNSYYDNGFAALRFTGFRCHGKGSYSYGIPFRTLGGERSLLDSNATGTPRSVDHVAIVVVTYALYACVADCADAMADAWEDTADCAHADCLHGNILK